ncbi:MAG: MerR family transcriptional regulator [Chloroflexi bacterium]|nr:MerR family transcriptional regulator [Chloroflexota bacterium]
MTPSDRRYALTELADLAGVTPRTVRYYQTQGLLASPGVPGPGAKYDDHDLARLRLIRRLQRDHLPLAEIRRRLGELDDDEIGRLVDDSTMAASPPTDSALEYVQRILSPGHRVAEARPALMRQVTASPASPSSAALPAAPPSVERSQWERIDLTPDIELHVRRPLTRLQSRQVDRLVSIARDLLEEDPS